MILYGVSDNESGEYSNPKTPFLILYTTLRFPIHFHIKAAILAGKIVDASVMVALTGLPIRYSVIVALTGLYSQAPVLIIGINLIN